MINKRKFKQLEEEKHFSSYYLQYDFLGDKNKYSNHSHSSLGQQSKQPKTPSRINCESNQNTIKIIPSERRDYSHK